MEKLYKEFKSSLKNIALEEIVDLFFFRPISFFCVKGIYRLPVTPNQVSVISMMMGILSGIFFAFGDRKSFVTAGICYAAAHILDCCDGMIARLKNSGSPLGRIIDGWTDYVTSVAAYIGLLLGLYNGSFILPVSSPWFLMIPASFSLALHAMLVDYYRREFMTHGLGNAPTIQEDFLYFSNLLEQMNKSGGKYLTRVMIAFYLGYTKIQMKKNTIKKVYSRDHYNKTNRVLLVAWNLIGLSTHIFVLILAAFLYNPMIYFYYILGFANIWMVVMAVIQVKAQKAIPAKPG